MDGFVTLRNVKKIYQMGEGALLPGRAGGETR